VLQTTAIQHKVAETTNPVKVLGLIWNTQTDLIYLSPCTSSGNLITILQWSSSVFDPLGLITPVTISAKLFLQQLWQEHIGWDTTLIDNLLSRWKVISDSIVAASTLWFPRKYAATLLVSQSVHTYLYVFADASLKSYGAVAYIQQDQGLPSFEVEC